jgi:hypothetical protein
LHALAGGQANRSPPCPCYSKHITSHHITSNTIVEHTSTANYGTLEERPLQFNGKLRK